MACACLLFWFVLQHPMLVVPSVVVPGLGSSRVSLEQESLQSRNPVAAQAQANTQETCWVLLGLLVCCTQGRYKLPDFKRLFLSSVSTQQAHVASRSNCIHSSVREFAGGRSRSLLALDGLRGELPYAWPRARMQAIWCITSFKSFWPSCGAHP